MVDTKNKESNGTKKPIWNIENTRRTLYLWKQFALFSHPKGSRTRILSWTFENVRFLIYATNRNPKTTTHTKTRKRKLKSKTTYAFWQSCDSHMRMSPEGSAAASGAAKWSSASSISGIGMTLPPSPPPAHPRSIKKPSSGPPEESTHVQPALHPHWQPTTSDGRNRWRLRSTHWMSLSILYTFVLKLILMYTVLKL